MKCCELVRFGTRTNRLHLGEDAIPEKCFYREYGDSIYANIMWWGGRGGGGGGGLVMSNSTTPYRGLVITINLWRRYVPSDRSRFICHHLLPQFSLL